MAGEAVSARWLAAVLRNHLDQDEVLGENRAIVVQPPGDPLTVVVLQPNGSHLMVQVNNAELIVR